jgi:hypothetical protein
MPRFLITTRRDQRANAKPASDIVKGMPGITVAQVHSPDMVTVETSDALAAQLRESIQATYYVEPEIHRDLD